MAHESLLFSPDRGFSVNSSVSLCLIVSVGPARPLSLRCLLILIGSLGAPTGFDHLGFICYLHLECGFFHHFHYRLLLSCDQHPWLLLLLWFLASAAFHELFGTESVSVPGDSREHLVHPAHKYIL